jgi:hypothetical protein
MSERDDAATSEGASAGDTPTSAPAPIEVPPFVAWMGRNGWLVLIPLILLELGFHGWAVWRSRSAETVRTSHLNVSQATCSSADGNFFSACVRADDGKPPQPLRTTHE